MQTLVIIGNKYLSYGSTIRLFYNIEVIGIVEGGLSVRSATAFGSFYE